MAAVEVHEEDEAGELVVHIVSFFSVASSALEHGGKATDDALLEDSEDDDVDAASGSKASSLDSKATWPLTVFKSPEDLDLVLLATLAFFDVGPCFLRAPLFFGAVGMVIPNGSSVAASEGSDPFPDLVVIGNSASTSIWNVANESS